MSNLAHIAEIAVLLLVAYLVGCVIGYVLRRVALAGKTEKTATIPAARIAAVTGATLVTAPAIGPVTGAPIPAFAPVQPGALPTAAAAALEAAIASAISATAMTPLAGVAELPKFAPLAEPAPPAPPPDLQPATRPGEVRFDPRDKDAFPDFEPPTTPQAAVAAAAAAVAAALAEIEVLPVEIAGPVTPGEAGDGDAPIVAAEPSVLAEALPPVEPETGPATEAATAPLATPVLVDAALPLAAVSLQELVAEEPEPVAPADPVAAAEWFVTAEIEPLPPVAPPVPANSSEADEAAAMRAIEGGWTRRSVPRSGT